MENDFKNQYLYFNYDSSKYPFITSILSQDRKINGKRPPPPHPLTRCCRPDPIYKIIEYLPKLNEFINNVQYEINMRYTKEEMNSINIDEKYKNDIKVFNQFIEQNENIFGQNKKLDKNTKIFEIVIIF